MRAALAAEFGGGWHGFAAKDEHELGVAVSGEGGAVHLLYAKHRFALFRHAEALSIMPTMDAAARSSLLLYVVTVLVFLVYMGQAKSCANLREMYGQEGGGGAAAVGEEELLLAAGGEGEDAKPPPPLQQSSPMTEAQQAEVVQCEWSSSMMLFVTIALAVASAAKRFFNKLRKRNEYRAALRSSAGAARPKAKPHPSATDEKKRA